MLTILTIEDKQGRAGAERFCPLLPNSLKVHETKGKIPIRHIEYINRNGRVNWHRISKKTGNERHRLLYSGAVAPADDADLRLFEPFALRQRLCSNMALSVLEMMKEGTKDLRTGLYDPEGEFCDLPEYLLKFTDKLVVVTKNHKVYRQQAQRLLEETGAVLCVTSRAGVLSDCGLIVSPCVLDVKFTPLSTAVILTCHKPKIPLACRVYYSYSFHLGSEFEALKPEGLSSEVFAGALYSLCGFYAFGSVVPLVCTSPTDTQTALSLRRYLCSCVTT